ncbi:helix-turn-helix domain-containing protein [Nocardia sp. NPDC055002]
MAKKPLAAPRAPAGPQRDFFLALQGLVMRAGDPSVGTIAEMVGRSRQVVHRALIGPALPSRDLVERLVGALAGASMEEPDGLMHRFRRLQFAALADSRGSYSPVADAQTEHVTDRAMPAQRPRTPEFGNSNTNLTTQTIPDVPTVEPDSDRTHTADVPTKERRSGRRISPKVRGAHTPARAALANELVRLSLASGKSMAVIARESGTSQSSVDKWMHGERTPDMTSIVKLSMAFGLNETQTNYLLDLHRVIKLETSK